MTAAFLGHWGQRQTKEAITGQHVVFNPDLSGAQTPGTPERTWQYYLSPTWFCPSACVLAWTHVFPPTGQLSNVRIF